MKILVINCGSSSLKFELLAIDPPGLRRDRLARGVVQEIGPRAHTVMSAADGRSIDAPGPVADHAAAALSVIAWLRAGDPHLALDAIAHRIVHGGDRVRAPMIADAGVIAALEEASRFAPLHNPPALATIRALSASVPGVPAIVVADTAFHQTIPPAARTYAIPREVAARLGIRRFGFHGVGHSWMLDRYAEISGRPAAALNLITLQLGAGCSVAAIRAGRSVDTSMGLTPLEGLMMATRSGDLDPAILNYLGESEKLSPAAVERMLNRESGLLGVSGVSGDLRELDAAAPSNPAAALAIEMFCYRARKYVGAYAAVLGRVDAVIFGAGIGEHSVAVRARICAGLENLGIVLDESANRAADGREACFSAAGSPVALWVVPLDEEYQIARGAAQLLARAA
ncbi:MAG TPA: acetate/propionate family kinase [Candidatus Binataceae bacterium]|nr:acetate/propionate family kinase [Candidatus Binataceae bacterium]